MAILNRAALKAFFETGDKPTEAQFADLIDSFLNLVDGGAISNETEFTSETPTEIAMIWDDSGWILYGKNDDDSKPFFFIDQEQALINNGLGEEITLGLDGMLLNGVRIRLLEIPSFDNDAAAGLGGLGTGFAYKTTGLGLAPLNVAGIVMVKL